MLDRTVTVEKIIDAALLDLWYADHHAGYSDSWRQEQVKLFRNQAQALVILLEREVGLASSYKMYKGINISEEWLPYFQDRENKYQHPSRINYESLKDILK